MAPGKEYEPETVPTGATDRPATVPTGATDRPATVPTGATTPPATDAVPAWDPLLYAGAARHYAVGRVGYPPELADIVVRHAGLDQTSTVVDVGCGPGGLTVLLAPHVGRAIGVDPDPDMLAEAARLADERAVGNVEWRRMPAEDLPADLIDVAAVIFAQSFHWMDRPRVATAARRMLSDGGSLIQVHATTHRGVATDQPLPHPQPPWDAMDALVRRYLGPDRRAGGRVLPEGTPGAEDVVFLAAGFSGPDRVEIPGRDVDRTVTEVMAAVYSLSSSAPHLFADRLADFDSELRALLVGAADGPVESALPGSAAEAAGNAGGAVGVFSERLREIAVDFWR